MAGKSKKSVHLVKERPVFVRNPGIKFMVIGLLTDGIFPLSLGGMQKNSYYLAKYFARYQNKVLLYIPYTDQLPDPDELPFSKEEMAFIELVFIPYPKVVYFPGHYLRKEYVYSKRISKHLEGRLNELDIILAQGFTGWHHLKRRGDANDKVPVCVSLHGLNMFQRAPSFWTKLQHYMLRPAALYNMRKADYVISYGGKISELIKRKGITEQHLMEMTAGIDKDWLNPDINAETGIRKLIFIGRYERVKGIEELNDALSKLVNTFDFEMTFIGPIPENKRIHSTKVQYLGEIMDAEKVKSILKKNDILVCPSYSEGMPNVILEAMASGLAVIACDVGAIGLLVSDDTGWLIEPGLQTSLLEAMKAAIRSDEASLLKMRQNAYQLIKEKFTWEIVIEGTIRSLEIKVPVT